MQLAHGVLTTGRLVGQALVLDQHEVAALAAHRQHSTTDHHCEERP